MSSEAPTSKLLRNKDDAWKNATSWFFPSISLIAITIIGFQLLDTEPYMDEIFHIPQAFLICNGDFASWDSKITTFPGLYYSVCLFDRLSRELGVYSLTSVASLRSINFCASLLILFYSSRYWRTIHRQIPTANGIIPSLVFLYPLSAFYYPLFYTDTISTAMVLVFLAYAIRSSAMEKKVQLGGHLPILIMASLAILSRQTNVLWILFFIGISCQAKFYEETKCDTAFVWSFLHFCGYLMQNCITLVLSVWSSLLPVLCFAVFVVYNRGIVVGDKENHKPTIHFAMLSHCLAIIGALNLPNFIATVFASNQWNAKANAKLPWMWCIVFGIVGSLGMIYGSKSHPFLLADNRHLSFYVWRRVLSLEKARLAISPLYTFSISLFFREISKREKPLWILIFLVASSLALLPTPLLEFRYFTVPVLIGFMHSNKELHEESNRAQSIRSFFLILFWLAFLIVNAVSAYIYLYQSFLWPDGTLARFMY